MEKSKVKKHLLEHQEALIQDLKSLMNNLSGSSDFDENETIKLDDLSQQSENLTMLSNIGTQLQIAQDEYQYLLNLHEQPCTKVTEGALVIADKLTFYVGISSTHNNIDNQDVIGISKNSPLYTLLHGKKIGDQFPVGKKICTIENIL